MSERLPAPLQGAVAVVTGASSGLGARFGRVLHAAGATVVLAARRLERLEDLSRELGDRSSASRCDVADDADRERLITEALDRHGRIDILLNNAGIGDPGPAEYELLADFRRVLEVNLVAPFHLSQLVARDMLGRGQGSIVNIASIFGLVGSAPINQAGYCASKGAVINLTRELAAQWAGRGVRVNGIAPGWFESEMTEDMWSDERSINYVRRNTPAGRAGRPEELDATLLLLAGEGGSFINGQVITVDGGWTAR